MKYPLLVVVSVAVLATSAMAQESLLISMGTRETGSTAMIGENGGASGSIEWLDIDAQTLALDGMWYQFTFDMDAVGVSAFTGDGILDGLAGTLEHIRIRSNGFAGPITLWIDNVTDSIDPAGPPPPTDVIFGDFEGYEAEDEVLFQEPGFSGSTDSYLNLDTGPNVAGVDNTVAYAGEASYKVEFQFIDNSMDNWLRLTTYAAANQPNPTIAYDQDSVVSFWIMGIPEPSTLVLLGLSAVVLVRRR